MNLLYHLSVAQIFRTILSLLQISAWSVVAAEEVLFVFGLRLMGLVEWGHLVHVFLDKHILRWISFGLVNIKQGSFVRNIVLLEGHQVIWELHVLPCHSDLLCSVAFRWGALELYYTVRKHFWIFYLVCVHAWMHVNLNFVGWHLLQPWDTFHRLRDGALLVLKLILILLILILHWFSDYFVRLFLLRDSHFAIVAVNFWWRVIHGIVIWFVSHQLWALLLTDDLLHLHLVLLELFVLRVLLAICLHILVAWRHLRVIINAWWSDKPNLLLLHFQILDLKL